MQEGNFLVFNTKVRLNEERRAGGANDCISRSFNGQLVRKLGKLVKNMILIEPLPQESTDFDFMESSDIDSISNSSYGDGALTQVIDDNLELCGDILEG